MIFSSMLIDFQISLQIDRGTQHAISNCDEAKEEERIPKYVLTNNFLSLRFFGVFSSIQTFSLITIILERINFNNEESNYRRMK